MSRTEPDLEWTKRTARDEHIAALRGLKIGPLFPSEPGHKPGILGSRRENRLGKDTKPPYQRSRRRQRRPITVSCLSCRWSTESTTWRPAKRLLRAHAQKKHRAIA